MPPLPHVAAPPTRSVAAQAAGTPASVSGGPCKFFGSAKGCSNDGCLFSHEAPNSVPPCSFKQRLGHCERGEACTFRHLPWASAEQARQHYAARGGGAVEESILLYKKLHRDVGAGKKSTDLRIGREHAELSCTAAEKAEERELQVETYGSAAMKMMEKMGYKVGSGLGKHEEGNTKLVGPCLALEQAAQKSALGFGHFSSEVRCSAAERAARLAAARVPKKPRMQEGAFVVHTLLSDEDSDSDGHSKDSDGNRHRQATDVLLAP